MTLDEVLSRIINDGIEAAKHDYAPENYGGDRPTQRGLLAGSVAGFEACRGKTPDELKALLHDARQKSHDAMATVYHLDGKRKADLKAVWYAKGYEGEVEWVCNCVSAVLMNEGLPTIVPPTARGMMRVAEIVGVK